MAHCPECDAELEGDLFELEEGEVVECPECGVDLEVVSTTPLELEPVELDEDDLDDDHENYEEEEWD